MSIALMKSSRSHVANFLIRAQSYLIISVCEYWLCHLYVWLHLVSNPFFFIRKLTLQLSRLLTMLPANKSLCIQRPLFILYIFCNFIVLAIGNLHQEKKNLKNVWAFLLHCIRVHLIWKKEQPTISLRQILAYFRLWVRLLQNNVFRFLVISIV